MKVTDLMIGDWYTWEAEGKKYPFQVTKETFKLLDEDIANFQPIPLSEEILIKNKFINLGEYEIGVSPYGYTMYLIENYYKNYVLAIDSFNDSDKYVYLNVCNYIHELQHALKLYKIEKEIVL